MNTLLHHIPFPGEAPKAFNDPFQYTPHPWIEAARDDLLASLRQDEGLLCAARQGKMFGVMTVRLKDGSFAYLKAYSGLLLGRDDVEGFVPPVFSIADERGHFKQEERRISLINKQIETLSQDRRLAGMAEQEASMKRSQEAKEMEWRTFLKAEHVRRKLLRQMTGLSEAQKRELTAESQRQRADFRRWKKQIASSLASVKQTLEAVNAPLEALKKERKERSLALQTWLFEHYVFTNFLGESKGLRQIFRDFRHEEPPSGAGDCALIKLLYYAQRTGLQPVQAGEFWVGEPTQGDIRQEGRFYGACSGKCKPILRFLLRGLRVEEPQRRAFSIKDIDIVFQDSQICLIFKPAGLLSVKGNTGEESVEEIFQDLWGNPRFPVIVHRLDRDTSGLMLLAKTKEAYHSLQDQFLMHEIRKTYTALLDGMRPISQEGDIFLPLSPVIEDRPRQQVDFLHGKPAHTHYRVLWQRGGHTLVNFFPTTGRAHQLRLHAAHKDGLAMPIFGDPLYGTACGRMCLCANEIEFFHPLHKDKPMRFSVAIDFPIPKD